MEVEVVPEGVKTGNGKTVALGAAGLSIAAPFHATKFDFLIPGN